MLSVTLIQKRSRIYHIGDMFAYPVTDTRRGPATVEKCQEPKCLYIRDRFVIGRTLGEPFGAARRPRQKQRCSLS
jgi:hypothetical protein